MSWSAYLSIYRDCEESERGEVLTCVEELHTCVRVFCANDE